MATNKYNIIQIRGTIIHIIHIRFPLKTNQYSISVQNRFPSGTIYIVSWDQRGSVAMFACSQTFVCVQANSCLAIGKHDNGASIAPQGIMFSSSKQSVSLLQECLLTFSGHPTGPLSASHSVHHMAARHDVVHRHHVGNVHGTVLVHVALDALRLDGDGKRQVAEQDALVVGRVELNVRELSLVGACGHRVVGLQRHGEQRAAMAGNRVAVEARGNETVALLFSDRVTTR